MHKSSEYKCVREKTTTSSQVNIAELAADWCESLHGGYSFSEGIRRFLIDVGAEAGLIVRINHSDVHASKFIAVDLKENSLYVSKLKRSYAACVLGDYLTKSQSSRLWLSSQVEDTPEIYNDPSLTEWHDARSLSETAVIVLSVDEHKSDIFEIHFREPVSRSLVHSLENLLITLCRSWVNRTSGLFSKALYEKCHPFARKQTGDPVLGCNNPAKLSRSEFRVCMLLSSGLSIEAITQELSVSKSTVRSHLRVIYSKTNTSGHAELVYRLLANPAQNTTTAVLSA